jgi:hypothetical protein
MATGGKRCPKATGPPLEQQVEGAELPELLVGSYLLSFPVRIRKAASIEQESGMAEYLHL